MQRFRAVGEPIAAEGGNEKPYTLKRHPKKCIDLRARVIFIKRMDHA